MFALLGEIFSYSFLVRALVVGSLVALCAALLGVSLVLKRYSMIGDGLSHVGFGALSIAMAMNAAPLAVAIPVVILGGVPVAAHQPEQPPWRGQRHRAHRLPRRSRRACSSPPSQAGSTRMFTATCSAASSP